MKKKLLLLLLSTNYTLLIANEINTDKELIVSKLDFIEILSEIKDILMNENIEIELYSIDYSYTSLEITKIFKKTKLNLLVLKDNINKLSQYKLKQHEKLQLHYLKNDIEIYYDYLKEYNLICKLDISKRNILIRKKVLKNIKKVEIEIDVRIKDFIGVLKKSNIKIIRPNIDKENKNLKLLKENIKGLDYKLFKLNKLLLSEEKINNISILENKKIILSKIYSINNFNINQKIKEISINFEEQFLEYIDSVIEYNKYKVVENTSTSETNFLLTQVEINFGILIENIKIYMGILDELE